MPRPRGGRCRSRKGSMKPTGVMGDPNVLQSMDIARSEWSVNTTKRQPRGNAAGTRPFEGHRHARSAPGKVGSPTEITVSAGHRHLPRGRRMRAGPVQPGRPVSDASGVGGGPPCLGEERIERGRIERFVLAFFLQCRTLIDWGSGCVSRRGCRRLGAMGGCRHRLLHGSEP